MADPKTKTPDSLVGMLKWNPASGKWFVWDGAITGVVTISGTVAVSGPLTDAQMRAAPVVVDTELPTAAALADATANPTVPSLGAYGFVYNPAGTWDRARGSKEQGAFVSSPPMSIRLDDGATYLYVGKAAMGAATSAASWQIARITQTDTTMLWCDGDGNFNNVWDNRASLSYS